MIIFQVISFVIVSSLIKKKLGLEFSFGLELPYPLSTFDSFLNFFIIFYLILMFSWIIYFLTTIVFSLYRHKDLELKPIFLGPIHPLSSLYNLSQISSYLVIYNLLKKDTRPFYMIKRFFIIFCIVLFKINLLKLFILVIIFFSLKHGSSLPVQFALISQVEKKKLIFYRWGFLQNGNGSKLTLIYKLSSINEHTKKAIKDEIRSIFSSNSQDKLDYLSQRSVKPYSSKFKKPYSNPHSLEESEIEAAALVSKDEARVAWFKQFPSLLPDKDKNLIENADTIRNNKLINEEGRFYRLDHKVKVVDEDQNFTNNLKFTKGYRLVKREDSDYEGFSEVVSADLSPLCQSISDRKCQENSEYGYDLENSLVLKGGIRSNELGRDISEKPLKVTLWHPHSMNKFSGVREEESKFEEFEAGPTHSIINQTHNIDGSKKNPNVKQTIPLLGEEKESGRKGANKVGGLVQQEVNLTEKEEASIYNTISEKRIKIPNDEILQGVQAISSSGDDLVRGIISTNDNELEADAKSLYDSSKNAEALSDLKEEFHLFDQDLDEKVMEIAEVINLWMFNTSLLDKIMIEETSIATQKIKNFFSSCECHSKVLIEDYLELYGNLRSDLSSKLDSKLLPILGKKCEFFGDLSELSSEEKLKLKNAMLDFAFELKINWDGDTSLELMSTDDDYFKMDIGYINTVSNSIENLFSF